MALMALVTACSSSSNSLQNVPREVLLSGSEALSIEGKQIVLNADVSSSSNAGDSENDQTLAVKVEIITSDETELPVGLGTDAVWLMAGDEIWGSSYDGEQLKDDRTRIIKIASGGSGFQAAAEVDVIVRIRHNGRTYLLKSTGQEISQTM